MNNSVRFLIAISLMLMLVCFKSTLVAQQSSSEIRTESFFYLPFDIGLYDTYDQVVMELQQRGLSIDEERIDDDWIKLSFEFPLANVSMAANHRYHFEVVLDESGVVGYSSSLQEPVFMGYREMVPTERIDFLKQNGFQVDELDTRAGRSAGLCECDDFETGGRQSHLGLDKEA